MPLIVEVLPPLDAEIKAQEEADDRSSKATREWWLIWLTGLLVLVTGLLAIFTARLWSATGKLVMGAEIAAQRELRAYIGHMPTGGAHFQGHTEKSPLRRPEVTFKGVKYFDWNYGKTPAKRVKMFVRITVDRVPDEEELDIPLTETHRQKVVQIVHPQQNIGRIITVEDIDNELTPDHTFFLYGHVDYTDVFGEQWRRRFAFSHIREMDRLERVAEEWVAHATHNDELHWNVKKQCWEDDTPQPS